MTTMNVSLPDSLRDYVERQIAQGGYSSVSEYIRQLIRDAQKRETQQRLEALLLEGLDSGEATPMTDDDWAEIRRTVKKRLSRRRKS